tara:strand:+ start:555 stop:1898 length:1344 start_codon:yes stop_codon:yes gene_type:complete
MKKEKNSKESLFKAALSIFQRDIFVYFLSILTGVIVARKLGPEMLGIWVVMALIPSYAEAFGRLKTDIASVYVIGKGHARPEEALFSMNIFALLTSTIIVLLLLWQIDFINEFFSQSASDNYKEALIIIILFIPFEFLMLNYGYFNIAHENTVVYNNIKVIKGITNFLVVAFFLLVLDFKIWALVFARSLSIVLPLIYAFLNLDRSNWIPLRSRWNSTLSIELLRYAFNFYVIGIISHIHELSIKTISAIYLSSSELAFYSQGEAASKMLNRVPESLRLILYPRISGLKHSQEAIEISCQSFRLTFLVLIICGIILFIIAKPLIVFLYGDIFEPTSEVLIIAIPGIIIGGSCLVIKSYFEGIGKADLIAKIQAIPVIIQIILAYLFLNIWGLMGAAIAFSIGFSLFGLSIFVVFLIETRISIFKMIPNLEDVKTLYLSIFPVKNETI